MLCRCLAAPSGTDVTQPLMEMLHDGCVKVELQGTEAVKSKACSCVTRARLSSLPGCPHCLSLSCEFSQLAQQTMPDHHTLLDLVNRCAGLLLFLLAEHGHSSQLCIMLSGATAGPC